MPTNDQVAEIQKSLESKFMEILSQPDVVIPAEEISDGALTGEQRATLQAVLESEMPTPAEIEQQAEIAEHNAAVQKKRDEKQARKLARRVSQIKRRRSR